MIVAADSKKTVRATIQLTQNEDGRCFGNEVIIQKCLMISVSSRQSLHSHIAGKVNFKFVLLHTKGEDQMHLLHLQTAKRIDVNDDTHD